MKKAIPIISTFIRLTIMKIYWSICRRPVTNAKVILG